MPESRFAFFFVFQVALFIFTVRIYCTFRDDVRCALCPRPSVRGDSLEPHSHQLAAKIFDHGRPALFAVGSCFLFRQYYHSQHHLNLLVGQARTPVIIMTLFNVLCLLCVSLGPSLAWISTSSSSAVRRPFSTCDAIGVRKDGLWSAPSSSSTVVLHSARRLDGSEVEEDLVGFNELHTLLRDAVEGEDYVEAGRISNVMLKRLYGDLDSSSMSDEEKRVRRKKMSWRGLGAAPWLTERLDALNYTFPTTIQINAMEAVNAILNNTDDVVETTSLEERVDLCTDTKDMGIVVSGATGSGKTLAYLVPLLSTLSDSLFKRQRIRVGAEEMVGDTTGDVSSADAILRRSLIFFVLIAPCSRYCFMVSPRA